MMFSLVVASFCLLLVQVSGQNEYIENGNSFEFDEPNNAVIGGNDIEGYIINGEEAKPNSWPWMVRTPRRCGASLIAPTWVLSAAHCTNPLGDLIFGAHDHRKTDAEEPTRARVPIKRFINHPKYNPSLLTDDIALIELTRPVTYTQHIQPVALPSYSDAKVNLTGQSVTMIGWGRPRMSSNDLSPVLRQATTPIISNYECSQFHNGKGGRIKLIHSHMCTSHKERKAGCHGDSGSPVNWKRESGNYTQVGIASFVFPRGVCDREGGVPTGHVRVGEYLKWISETTGIRIED